MINKQALRKKMLTSGLKKKCGPKRRTKRPVLCRRKGSAFSAVSNADQPISQFIQVRYNQEIFDLNNEYNPATSVFTAKRSGIYVFFASIDYQPATDVAGTVSIAILANELLVDSEAIRLDGTIVSVTGIVQLRAGDRVAVFALVSAGSGDIVSSLGTRFEGSRVQ